MTHLALMPRARATDLQVLVCASSLAQKQLWTYVPNPLGWRTELGAVGGRLFLVQSFVAVVLSRVLWRLPRPVGRRLPHRPTGGCATPAGWAAGMGA